MSTKNRDGYMSKMCKDRGACLSHKMGSYNGILRKLENNRPIRLINLASRVSAFLKICEAFGGSNFALQQISSFKIFVRDFTICFS